MKSLALSLLLPLVVGPLTFVIMQTLKRVSVWVDHQSPIIKRFAVALIAFALTLAGNLTGVDLACDPDTNCLAVLDHDTVKALVAAVLAIGMHHLKKATKV